MGKDNEEGQSVNAGENERDHCVENPEPIYRALDKFHAELSCWNLYPFKYDSI